MPPNPKAKGKKTRGITLLASLSKRARKSVGRKQLSLPIKHKPWMSRKLKMSQQVAKPPDSNQNGDHDEHVVGHVKSTLSHKRLHAADEGEIGYTHTEPIHLLC